MIIKKAISAAVSAALALSGIAVGYAAEETYRVSAAGVSYKFDLGASPQSGFTSVSATYGYTADRGYGFSNNYKVSNQPAAGLGALSDAVRFNGATFNVKVPNGLYSVTVYTGKITRMSVQMEGLLQIVNITGSGNSDTVLVPVTDGVLNIGATPGRSDWTADISEIDVTQVSADTAYPKTVWFCGDSTVCNYYPKDTSVQAGWGQVFDKYIDKSWYVRDMASSGQYAKPFYEAGQFATIRAYGKKGDLFIISIGINDTNYSNADEYTTYVTKMVQEAKAKGVAVILVKQQGRHGDLNRKPALSGRWFGGQLDAIGKAEGVSVLDLFTPWQEFGMTLGYDGMNDYYMSGDDLHPNRNGAMKLAELASERIDWQTLTVKGSEPAVREGAVIDTSKTYLIKNKNSGLYMNVEGALSSGSNVALGTGTDLVWSFNDAGDSYYSITTDNKSLYLDVTGAKSAGGTNIGIYKNSGSSAQKFKLFDNGDGSYVIATMASSDKGCVEVKNAETAAGANIQQWEINGHACQSWILEPVEQGVKPAEEIITGDINHDGRVNVFDLIMLKRKLSGLTGAERQFADMNSDGVINGEDVSELSSYLVRKGDIKAAVNKSGFYYANEASYSKAITEKTNAGFKGENYINLENCEGSYIEWSITVPEDGTYSVSFKNANGTAANRTMQAYVDGKSWANISFPGTGAWTTWKDETLDFQLHKGVNKIKLVSSTANGGPNFDYIYFEKQKS